MKKLEITIFTLIIIAVNIPLFLGCSMEHMIYSLDAVKNGEIWRLLTHPFAHNSTYHMLIDSTAFLMLYYQLQNTSPVSRFLYIFLSGLFSFIAINFQLPFLPTNTYCGLSGIAHGLMVVIGLEMLYGTSELRKAGIIMLLIIFLKCLLETITGKIIFESFHFGNVGIPVTMSHTGGAIGGIISYYALNMNFLTKPQVQPSLT